MNWEEFQALSDEQKQSEFAKLNDKLSTATNESITGRKTLKAELEAAKSTVRTMLDKLGLDDVSELDGLPDAKGMAEAQKQVEAQVKRLTRELSEAQKAAADKDSALKGLRTDLALKEAMSKHQFIDDDVVKLLVNSRIEHEGDNVFFKGDDGAMLSLPDALAGIAKAKPHLLKAPANGGSGFTGNQGGQGTGLNVSAEQLSAMSDAQYSEFSANLALGKATLAT
jgi:hypothetical protein